MPRFIPRAALTAASLAAFALIAAPGAMAHRPPGTLIPTKPGELLPLTAARWTALTGRVTP